MSRPFGRWLTMIFFFSMNNRRNIYGFKASFGVGKLPAIKVCLVAATFRSVPVGRKQLPPT